jgi:alkaline phosphatase D
MIFTRRDFLKFSTVATYTLVVSTGLTACGGGGDSGSTGDDSSNEFTAFFNHGVASGDPLSDSLIIWTRVTSETEPEIDVTFEVATDSEFTNLVHNGTESVTADTDFTLKVDLLNLEPATKYYYRFHAGNNTSPVGIGKTLPVGDVSQVKFAVFSCANYTNGYFNVYREASKIEDLDVSLHLGDYIYEYGMFEADGETPAYATSRASEIGRELPSDNNGELLTLSDYRKRYALYHTDSGLQELHRVAPMISVWDDHEIANDTYRNGAENHSSGEGSFDERKRVALQAYFEWLPIRPINDREKIYRSFDFGNLLSLHMLETRLQRDKQLDLNDYFESDGSFNSDTFMAELTDEKRTLLGEEQLLWLGEQLAQSTATWQLLGQQVLMGKMNLPTEILMAVNSAIAEEDETAKKEKIDSITTLFTEYTMMKLLGKSGYSAEELAKLDSTLPYNLDAWDGYFYEREALFGTAKSLGKKVVVVAGDTHNGWANNLRDYSEDGTGEVVGVEFATPSVSSPGMEDYLYLEDDASSKKLEASLVALIDDLKYTNLNNRGFLTVTFTHDEVKGEWTYIDNIDSETYEVLPERGKEITVSASDVKI